jgi:hypothetical protein
MDTFCAKIGIWGQCVFADGCWSFSNTRWQRIVGAILSSRRLILEKVIPNHWVVGLAPGC